MTQFCWIVLVKWWRQELYVYSSHTLRTHYWRCKSNRMRFRTTPMRAFVTVIMDTRLRLLYVLVHVRRHPVALTPNPQLSTASCSDCFFKMSPSHEAMTTTAFVTTGGDRIKEKDAQWNVYYKGTSFVLFLCQRQAKLCMIIWGTTVWGSFPTIFKEPSQLFPTFHTFCSLERCSGSKTNKNTTWN